MSIRSITDETPAAHKRGPMCAVCNALAALDEDEATALGELLDDPAWTYAEIARRLRNDPDVEFKLSAQQLSRHHRGECWGGR